VVLVRLDAHGRLKRGRELHFRVSDFDPFDAHHILLVFDGRP
jgi:hypothetical protein